MQGQRRLSPADSILSNKKRKAHMHGADPDEKAIIGLIHSKGYDPL